MITKYYYIPCKNGQKKDGVQNGGIEIIKSMNIKDYIQIPYDNRRRPLNELKKVYEYIHNNNDSTDKKIITFGGDHSISIPTVLNSVNKYGKDNLFVIWIDAHTDINSPETSPSGNLHGMPLNYVSGITKLNWIKDTIKIEHIFYIGTRSIDVGEQELIDKTKINNYSMNYIRKYSIKRVIKNIINKINKLCDNPVIHISFDVDSITPELISSTGTPAPNGLSMYDIKCIFNELESKCNVMSIDVCEYNPKIGDKNKSLKNIKEIISII